MTELPIEKIHKLATRSGAATVTETQILARQYIHLLDSSNALIAELQDNVLQRVFPQRTVDYITDAMFPSTAATHAKFVILTTLCAHLEFVAAEMISDGESEERIAVGLIDSLITFPQQAKDAYNNSDKPS